MAEVGDRVRIAPTKVGGAAREGVVTGVMGRLLRIKWSTGGNSTIASGPGSVEVIGTIRKTPGTKDSHPTKTTKRVAKKADR